MRGDWMDEARRFEDTDKAIMDKLTREEMPDCCLDAIEQGEASCVFGCGSVVDTDHGMCLTCRDHSTNRLECQTCGRTWEQWNGEWEPAK